MRGSLSFARTHPFVTAFGLAFVVRCAALVALGIRSSGDTFGYLAAAAALRSDALTAADAFVNLPPLYVLALAVTGGGVAAGMLNVMAGAAIAPLLGIATARHLGRAAGMVAAGLVAIEPAFIQWSAYLLTDTLALFLLAVGIERSSAALAGARRGSSLIAGLAGGLAVLARSAYAAPVAALALAHARARPARLRVALFLLASLLVIAVPIARNAAIGIGPVPYRDQGWFLLWAGTTWTERGRGTVGVDIVYPPGHATWDAAQRQSFYRESVLRFVAERPAEMAMQIARKSVWFWSPLYPEWSTFHKLWSTAFYGLLYLLALLGLARSWRSPYVQALVLAILATHVVVALTIVDYDARYRLPAELCLLPLAATGIAAAVQRVTSSRQRSSASTVRSQV